MMGKMCQVHKVAWVLLIVGGLNWGLVALGSYMGSNWNVVNLLLGSWPAVETVVYLLVGLSALALLITHKGDCRACTPGM